MNTPRLRDSYGNSSRQELGSYKWLYQLIKLIIEVEGESRYKLSGDPISIPASSTDTEKDAAMGNKENIQHSSIPLSIASMNNKNRKLNFNSWINRNFRCCTMFSCKLVFISKRYSKIPREQSWWQKCVQMLKFTFHYIFTIPSQVKLSRKAL